MNSLADTLAQALREAPWEDRARPAQLPPAGAWRIWLLLGGRGAGKTLAAAHYVRARVEAGQARHVAIVGRTAADVRDVMVEGPSGLLAVAPEWFRPVYEPSKRRLTWPNGAVATTYSADEPDLLRGPQHDLAWADELAAWDRADDTWSNLMLGLRLGRDPRCVVSTTPRPIPIVRDLVKRAGQDVALTRMTTFENLSNLAPGFAADIVSRYSGTHLGRQELYAEILDESPGALWTREMIEHARVQTAPALVRVVVGVDPSVSATPEGASETGIIVAAKGEDGHGYVLGDATVRATPDAWARAVVDAYHSHQADRVVAEVNNGGDLVRRVLAYVDPNLPITTVRAAVGKRVRAEPVAALYEQGRIHHVGVLPDLEDQMVAWVQGSSASPDRLDALVWALTELFDLTGIFDPAAVEAMLDPTVEPLRVGGQS